MGRGFLLQYALRSLQRRPRSGILCIAVFSAEMWMALVFLGLHRGLSGFLISAADARNVLAMQPSVAAFEQSSVLRSDVEVLRTLGAAVVSPELVFSDRARLDTPKGSERIPLRGVDAEALDVHGIRWVSGRRPRGDGEAALGRTLAENRGLRIGDTVDVDDRAVRVVGIFTGPPLYDAEVWMELSALQSLTREEGRVSGAVMRVPDGVAPDEAIERWRRDPRLDRLKLVGEEQYLRDQAAQADLFELLGLLFGGLLAVGVGLGGSNAMLAVVADRRRELATLRAIGFQRRSIAAAILCELSLLALLGGVVASALALLAGGVSLRQMTASFRSVEVSVSIGPLDVAATLAANLLLAWGAGLIPALSASRIPVAEAIRS